MHFPEGVCYNGTELRNNRRFCGFAREAVINRPAARVPENRFHPLMVKMAGSAQLDRLYQLRRGVSSVCLRFLNKAIEWYHE